MAIRYAFTMRLKPGSEAEYKRRHDEIWPELLELMARDGVRNYSIYRDGLTLFAYLERDDPAPPGLPSEAIVWRWWESMAPLMETNDDFSPIQHPIEEVFHAD